MPASKGPWRFNLRNDFGQVPTVVVLIDGENYVVLKDKYDKQGVYDKTWVKKVYIGLVIDPEYPVGPDRSDDPKTAQNKMLFIGGTYSPRNSNPACYRWRHAGGF